MAQPRVSLTRQKHGWETTSHDYHAHVSTIERTPSVLPDAPRYPNVFRVLNNRVHEEESEEVSHQERLVQKQQTPTKPHKKNVQMAEQEKIIIQDNSGGKCEVVDESIDAETDGFIQQRRRIFELCKWKTFKTH